MDKRYTCEEVAELYGVKRITVYDWIKQKKLGAISLGKNYAVREEDLIAFEKARFTRGEEQ